MNTPWHHSAKCGPSRDVHEKTCPWCRTELTVLPWRHAYRTVTGHSELAACGRCGWWRWSIAEAIGAGFGGGGPIEGGHVGALVELDSPLARAIVEPLAGRVYADNTRLIGDLREAAQALESNCELFDGNDRIQLVIFRKGSQRAGVLVEQLDVGWQAETCENIPGLCYLRSDLHGSSSLDLRGVMVTRSGPGSPRLAVVCDRPERLLSQLGLQRMPVEDLPAWLETIP